MSERRKYRKGDIVKFNIYKQVNGYNIPVNPSPLAIQQADSRGYVVTKVRCDEGWHPEVCLPEELFEGGRFWVKASGVELVKAVEDAEKEGTTDTIANIKDEKTVNQHHTVNTYNQIKEILLSVKEALWNDSESYRAHITDNGGHASNFIITNTHDGSILFSASLISVTSTHKAKKLARAALSCAGYDSDKISEVLGGKYNYKTPDSRTVTKYDLREILNDFCEEVVPSYIDEVVIKEFAERSMRTR